jgi:hypothetical protein
MKKYSKENRGYMHLLNVIDTFSKLAWAIPIKNKDGVTVSKAFEKKKLKARNLKITSRPIYSILIKARNLKINILKVV